MFLLSVVRSVGSCFVVYEFVGLESNCVHAPLLDVAVDSEMKSSGQLVFSA